MTRYADPARCPDCRSDIVPGSAGCGACGLSLQGETAQQLFSALRVADDLLIALRAGSPQVGAAPEASPSPRPAYPVAAARQQHRVGLRSASVPKILLGLGAVCLLVAALVFLAVTWSVLGIGGRTATLVVLTLVAGGVAAWAARRGLPAAAESLSLVALGLLVLDIVGADNAGWFGDLTTSAFLILLGLVLLATGAGAALLARSRTTVRLVGAEVAAVVGAALMTGGVAAAQWLPLAPALLLAIVVAGAAAAAAYRSGLVLAAAGAAAWAAVAWLALTMYGLDRAGTHDRTWGTLWLELEVWPLLAAAVLAAAPVAVRRLPGPARVGAGSVAHLLVVVALLAPVEHWGDTGIVLVVLGVLAAAGAATWWLPLPWALVNGLTQVVGAVTVLTVGAVLTERALTRLRMTVDVLWSGRLGDRLAPAPSPADLPAGWLLPLCLLALLGTGWTWTRAVRDVDGVPAVVGVLADRRIAAALLAASVLGALAHYPVPVWLVVATLLLVSSGLTAWWLAGESLVALMLAAGYVVAAVALSLHADRLTAAALLVALVTSALVHLRSRGDLLAAAGGVALVLVLAASVWTWGAIADVEGVMVALTVLVVVGSVVLGAPYAPDRWWHSARPVLARTGVEVGAILGAVISCGTGLALAAEADVATWAAVYLTALGVVVTATALLRSDRRALGAVGGVLLAAATWVRLADLGVRAPEPYTLPSAAALLLVGLARLRREPGARTMGTLAPGLSLAVVPSLLWVLGDPMGLRTLLLGVGCLLLVTAGARLGWTAPLALGAAAGTVLVLRLAAPYLGDAVPRWVLIGGAGVLLVAMGATWERRTAEVRQVAAYVRTLR